MPSQLGVKKVELAGQESRSCGKGIHEGHGTSFLHKNAIVDECSLGRLGGHAFNHYSALPSCTVVQLGT